MRYFILSFFQYFNGGTLVLLLLLESPPLFSSSSTCRFFALEMVTSWESLKVLASVESADVEALDEMDDIVLMSPGVNVLSPGVNEPILVTKDKLG